MAAAGVQVQQAQQTYQRRRSEVVLGTYGLALVEAMVREAEWEQSHLQLQPDLSVLEAAAVAHVDSLS